MLVVDHIIGAADHLQSEKKTVRVMFEWFECEKGRIMKTAEDGTEMGIAVSGGVKRGSILFETEDTIYVSDITPCHLIEIKVDRTEQAARAGFELGNRHLSLKIEDGRILVPFDKPTFEYLQKLCFEVRETEDIFEEYTVCKAHGHSHHG